MTPTSRPMLAERPQTLSIRLAVSRHRRIGVTRYEVSRRTQVQFGTNGHQLHRLKVALQSRPKLPIAKSDIELNIFNALAKEGKS